MLNGFEDIALKRALDRQRALEANVFVKPPADWAAFNVLRGRWMELNDQIAELKKVLNDEEVKESNR